MFNGTATTGIYTLSLRDALPISPRAVYYRTMNRLPDAMGTAVNVQVMVFGNLGEDCATGVAFTRSPATGAREFYGEYLPNAQGEDVVAGIRTPLPINIAEIGRAHV